MATTKPRAEAPPDPVADLFAGAGVLAEMRAASAKALRARLRETMARAYAPPPRLTVSEWADQFRFLSAESSAEPGRWDTARVEVARGVMDAFSDPRVSRVTAMACAQLFKTEALNNLVGFHVSQDPAPMMVLQPTIAMAEAWSKDRLAPMLRDSPALSSRVGDPRSRDSDNTILHKSFTGGHITMAGANSPASLASRPIRIVLCDEVDRYPLSAGEEGDPVSLVIKRTETFWNRKIGLFSTPTVKGKSRIEASFEESDKRRFFVPCLHEGCGHWQHLRWEQVKPHDDAEKAAYSCEACGCDWSEGQRLRAIRRGRWRQTATFTCCGTKQEPAAWDAEGRSLCSSCAKPSPFNGHAGFHVNQLASPWTTIAKIVAEYIAAKPFPDRLKTWWNTAMAVAWEDAGETVDASGIAARREDYAAEPLPRGVLLLTCGVDLQPDRAELEVLGHGLEEETWSIEYRKIYGDPTTRQFWAALDEALMRRWRHPSGRFLTLETVCVDSGDGNHTQAVYDFVRPRASRRVWAIKGAGGVRPLWPEKATKNAAKKVDVFILGVNTGKQLVYDRLAILKPGPGYCHFPARYPEAYFEGLTVEKAITKYKNGFPFKVWEKPDGARNEPLDCRVYALAARHSLVLDLPRRAEILAVPDAPAEPAGGQRPAAAPAAPPAPPPAAQPRPRRRNRGVAA